MASPAMSSRPSSSSASFFPFRCKLQGRKQRESVTWEGRGGTEQEGIPEERRGNEGDRNRKPRNGAGSQGVLVTITQELGGFNTEHLLLGGTPLGAGVTQKSMVCGPCLQSPVWETVRKS